MSRKQLLAQARKEANELRKIRERVEKSKVGPEPKPAREPDIAGAFDKVEANVIRRGQSNAE